MRPIALKRIPALISAGMFSVICSHGGGSYGFSSTNFIAINDSMVLPTAATPYPSSIQVTTPPGLVVAYTTVTLSGLSHPFPSDISILLVGPQGQKTILMSEAGTLMQLSVTNLTITFDDRATNAIPLNSILTSGVFRPATRHFPQAFTFPPPAPPSNAYSPCTMSVFRGSDPNGSWKLYVVDNGFGDAGSISNGWTLNLTMGTLLQVGRSGTNLVLSWPTTATNCSLQSATALNSTAWTPVATAPTQVGSSFYVTNSIGKTNQFYRLIQ